ncbi:GIY-YIG nuclease family protein [Butyrivibrio sp. NC2002]|uniref:GIY-YIG nuclease family protein n=1 Tax=Butyrivibrio sp. NC2002 TaxID=1410610 RepID=UPI0006909C08|nr:GIY-YIG nuclease family protein [Butyrivibrio sp. NC2002]
MTLEQLMSFENIDDYNIWWYGLGIADDYMDDEKLLKKPQKTRPLRNANLDCVYLIMSGETGKTCRYRFAIKLIETGNDDYFEWERVPLNLDEYGSRIVFYRESGFSFYNSAKTAKDFVVDEIWGKVTNRTVTPFSTYDEVELSFSELRETVDNHYPDYYKALSCVKGIYMIVDGNTGKLYVGSAYGKDGIWGRWSSYSETYHGQNEELLKLYHEYGADYFQKFKYIILQVLPMKLSDREVIDRENAYKQRYMTREFGLNNN